MELILTLAEHYGLPGLVLGAGLVSISTLWRRNRCLSEALARSNDRHIRQLEATVSRLLASWSEEPSSELDTLVSVSDSESESD